MILFFLQPSNLLYRIWDRNDISYPCYRTVENRKENNRQCLADLADDTGIEATGGKAGLLPGWSMIGAARVDHVSLAGTDSLVPRVLEALDGNGARPSSRR